MTQHIYDARRQDVLREVDKCGTTSWAGGEKAPDGADTAIRVHCTTPWVTAAF